MKKLTVSLALGMLSVVAQSAVAHVAPCELEIKNDIKSDIFVVETNKRAVWVRGQRENVETKTMMINPEIAGAKGMTERPELKIYVEESRNDRKNLQHYFHKYTVVENECSNDGAAAQLTVSSLHDMVKQNPDPRFKVSTFHPKAMKKSMNLTIENGEHFGVFVLDPMAEQGMHLRGHRHMTMAATDTMKVALSDANEGTLEVYVEKQKEHGKMLPRYFKRYEMKIKPGIKGKITVSDIAAWVNEPQDKVTVKEFEEVKASNDMRKHKHHKREHKHRRTYKKTEETREVAPAAGAPASMCSGEPEQCYYEEEIKGGELSEID